MGVPIQRVSPQTVLGNHEERLRLVEFSGERFIYVGTPGNGDVPDDAILTPDSPPFQNGWTNAQGTTELISFVLRANMWGVLRGTALVGSGPDNSVVYTLPQVLWPKRRLYFTSRGAVPGSIATWYVEINGDVFYEKQLGP